MSEHGGNVSGKQGTGHGQGAKATERKQIGPLKIGRQGAKATERKQIGPLKIRRQGAKASGWALLLF